jgi:hypothetical protein
LHFIGLSTHRFYVSIFPANCNLYVFLYLRVISELRKYLIYL